jgi:phosphocarrier protein
MITRDIMISNRLGLHARAAAKLVSVANRFGAEVTLVKDGHRVNGKSIMGVMMLAASRGTMLQLQVNGDGEEDAVAELVALIDDKFGEEE